MTVGDLGYSDFYYPIREEIVPRRNITIHFANESITLPDMKHADIATHVKAPYYPITAQMMLTILMIMLSVLIFNLLLGLAVSDVQVFDFLISNKTKKHNTLYANIYLLMLVLIISFF